VDPSGEIHPSVIEINQQFHIKYVDYIPIKENENEYEYVAFKKIYNKSGKITGNRSRLKENEYSEYEELPKIKLNEELQGRFRKFEKKFYIFPEWIRKHKGKPYYLIADEKEFVTKALDWGDFTIDIVEDFVVTTEYFTIIATVFKDGNNDILFPKTELWMFNFNRNNGKLLFSKKVGDPTFIYNFPGVSNVIIKKGSVFFVWNKSNKDDGKIKLHLVNYNLNTQKYIDRSLPFESTRNISISIGANDNLICLAYHGISSEMAVQFIPINTGQK
jgi:hypothetical protein